MADACCRVDSERNHFMMHWNFAQYDDGTRFVFCDELEEYTFHPYVGGLKEIPGYCEDKAAFEDVRIFLIINYSGKLMKVPCNVVEEFKKIYINEGNFNKYWKLISENICRGIRRRMNSNEVTHASMNERVDLSLVETPSRTAAICSAFTIEYKGKEIDIETQRLISKRASALEDNRIRFVYAKSDNFVHDKTCVLVDKIKYWDFGASEELPADREVCSQCKKRLYIRNAIKSDTKRFAWYLRFFEKGRVSNRVLEQFLCNNDVKLHMDSIDELVVKCNKDTWHIKMNAQGVYTLYHNNYVMVSEEERYITTGLHIQKHHPPYLPGILAYIAGYDWQKHLDSKQKVAVVEEVPEVAVEESVGEKENLWIKLKQWLKRIFRQRK